ncbi:MAG: M56 family metallopeptidase [Lachnospiraceae bacterium]|nr:M56 family metallopeptidase [Lachnospiraceae bacterium]
MGQGQPASEKLQDRVREVAERFQIRFCGQIRICSWAHSPFVTGILFPVLVLPPGIEGTEDSEDLVLPSGEKGTEMPGELLEDVILHELLHMQYGDVAVNLFLHGIRILHWFNPFVWYVIRQIQNDNEVLCDERVLERLDRSRHKGYGILLLKMADKGRSPTVGTTHMARGYQGLRVRLRRIADFGHVPKGNALISFCMTLVLTLACVGYAPREAAFSVGTLQTELQWKHMFFRASLYEVSTPQEALYIYMRALQERNTGYMALVVPEEERQAYQSWVREAWKEGNIYGSQLQPTIGENSFFPVLLESSASLEITGFSQGETECLARLLISSHVWGEGPEYVLLLRLQKEYGWKVEVLEERLFSWEDGILEEGSGWESEIPEEWKNWKDETFHVMAGSYETWGFSSLPRGEFYFGKGEAFERAFSDTREYKKIRLTYTGQEELAGKLLEIQYGPEELLEEERRKEAPDCEPGWSEIHPDGISSRSIEIPEDWDGTFQAGFSTDGNPEGIKPFSWWICIYVDGQLWEEFLWEGGGM